MQTVHNNTGSGHGDVQKLTEKNLVKPLYTSSHYKFNWHWEIGLPAKFYWVIKYIVWLFNYI